MKLFPAALVVIQVGASVTYFWGGDLKRGFYWAAAVVLTWTVTF